MSLLDKQEIKPKIVNVMLLDNEEQSKANEDLIIEEINDNEEEEEEEEEEEKEEVEEVKEEKIEEVKEEKEEESEEEEEKELLSEGLRKRKKSAQFPVFSQTRNK